MHDLVFKQCRIDGYSDAVDIAVTSGRIAAIAPLIEQDGPTEFVGGRYVCSGLVESHIHLDKAGILGRCPVCKGTLEEAITQTAAAKAAFTEEDIYERAERLLLRCISHGTLHMRTFVEVDPRVGLRGFRALQQLKKDYTHLIDLQLCAFAQEGITQEPATLALLEESCRLGADLVGGCPYTDQDPGRHVALILALAQQFDIDADFHLDFDLLPERTNLPHVLRETESRHYGGRVTIGHVTQLSGMTSHAVDLVAETLANAGIAVAALPATDLYLLGRDREMLVPRGVAPVHRLAAHGVLTSLATNNVLNPFTPYGDGSLVRIANLYCNLSHLATGDDLRLCFDMITRNAARITNAGYGISVGAAADLVIFDAPDPISVIRELAPTLAGWKNGRPAFRRPAAEIFA